MNFYLPPRRMVAVIILGFLGYFGGHPSQLSALEPQFHYGLWWENSGTDPVDSLGLRLGFQAERLVANFLVTKFPLAQTPVIDLADLHFEIRSPVLEIGTMVAPDYWSCLSASRSSLDAILPLDPESGRNNDFFAHDLPLTFASLSRSESARIIGAGVGLPRWFSALVFRNLSGDNAGWDHIGLMGRLPLRNGSDSPAWTVDLGLAWYHSWFQPTGAPGSWVSANDGSGLLMHQSTDWWLGGDLVRPQDLDHGQLALGVATDWLRLVIIAQNSAPRAMATGYSLGGRAYLMAHQSDGSLLVSVDLAASHANNLYRTAHGARPELSDSLKAGLALFPGQGFSFSAGTGWDLGMVPDAGDYAARFRSSSLTWKTGVDFTNPAWHAGLALDGTRQLDDLGSVTYSENLGAGISILMGTDFSCKLGISADLGMLDWSAQTIRLTPGLDIGTEGTVFGFHFGLQGGFPLSLTDKAVSTAVSASADLAVSWLISSCDKLEIRVSLGLPENATPSRLGAWLNADLWSHLDRRIEISFNP